MELIKIQSFLSSFVICYYLFNQVTELIVKAELVTLWKIASLKISLKKLSKTK